MVGDILRAAYPTDRVERAEALDQGLFNLFRINNGVPVRLAPWLAFASSSCRSVCGSAGAVTIRVIGRGLLYGRGA
jgi:hypothetical protein